MSPSIPSSSSERKGLLGRALVNRSKGRLLVFQSSIFYLSIVFTFANVILLFSRWAISRQPNVLPIGQLKRPTQFPNFDKLDWTDTEWRDNIIPDFPRVLTQVDRERPDFVFPTDVHRNYTRFGTLGYDDRYFLLTDSISIIAQYRTMDYGVQSCILRLYFPGNTELGADSNRTTTSGFPYWTMDSESVDVDIYWLNRYELVDVKTLSYSTKPQRGELFDSVKVKRSDITPTKVFPCESDSLYSFEVVCRSNPCRIEAWQDKVEAVGLLLIQKSFRSH